MGSQPSWRFLGKRGSSQEKSPCRPQQQAPSSTDPGARVCQKQAIASGKVDTVKPVVVQAVVTNSMQCKKIVLLVTVLGHIHDLSQISVEFSGANGSALLIWVPRGLGTSNIDKVMPLMETMEDYGITAADAIMFGQALETKLMQKHCNILEPIIDPFAVDLEVQCDINKQPVVQVYQMKEDGDVGCFIMLDVPSMSNYKTGARTHQEAAVEL
jgi:hypothetical protein